MAVGEEIGAKQWGGVGDRAPPGKGSGNLLSSREREGTVGGALPTEGMVRQRPRGGIQLGPPHGANEAGRGTDDLRAGSRAN